MFNRLFNLTITRVALLVGALMAISLVALPVYNLAFAQAADPIEYAENGMDPVATYTAVDPEGADIVWSVAGTDGEDFSIENGVLMFKSPPNFEDPMGGGTNGTSNTYAVTVEASDGGTMMDMEEVTVMVTNVDEPGTITLSSLQPQAGVELTATLSDPDAPNAPTGISGTMLQWEMSSSASGPWTAIEDETETTYTPANADAGYYLRVTAEYKDLESTENTKMAQFVSANTVRAGSAVGNTDPQFRDEDDEEITGAVVRTVRENTPSGQPVGDPVTATDDDTGDILTYALGGNAAVSFAIDVTNGQVMTKDDLNAEGTVSYSVTVTATDPFGQSDEITVTITVEDVNEPPTVSSGAASIEHPEGGTVLDTDLDSGSADPAMYDETDPDTDSTVMWSVAGADRGKFEIGATSGLLAFKDAPDYEMPGDANGDNVYEIMVVVTDNEGATGMMSVTVKVTNMNEPGIVALSSVQPRVVVPLTATLTDPDGGLSGVAWQWSRSQTAGGSFDDIEDATSATYTPVAGDADPDRNYLKATASYTDGEGSGQMAEMESVNSVLADTTNKAPYFPDTDADTEGMQDEGRERSVEENTEAGAADDGDVVGEPVTAMDPNGDPLTYKLGGADAARFKVDQDDIDTPNENEGGQIRVGAGTELDKETKDTYMVTVMATDSYGLTATTMVTIMITNDDEAPELTGEVPEDYAENGMDPVATYTAVDPEGADIVWSVAGTDGEDFSIENGVLMFKSPPNFEDPMGGGTNGTSNTYAVTVEASDGGTMMDTEEVTVKVTNVDEPGMITLSSLQPQAGVALTATLSDPDAPNAPTGISGTTRLWERSSSTSGSWKAIEDEIAMTYTPENTDAGYYLRVTAEYKDPESTEITKMAQVVSANRVQALSDTGNTAPEFKNDADAVITTDTRTVRENTPSGQPVGDPVTATDANAGDILTYALGGNAAVSFAIDVTNGQVMTKDDLNAEGTVSYSVTVTATDPFGQSDEITVTITVEDVNEPPTVSGAASIEHPEGDTVLDIGNGAAATYDETDPDTGSTAMWSVSGTDHGKFEIGETDGLLAFKDAPDYEMPGDANGDNVYEIMVVVTDNEGATGMMSVTVKVTNMNEPGIVALSSVQPRVVVPLTATLTDPDGGLSGVAWQWSRSQTAGGSFDDIEDATSATYTPVAGDADPDRNYLKATASYTDGEGSGQMAEMESVNSVLADTTNKAPYFPDTDADTEGMQDEGRERSVVENTEAGAADDGDVVGEPVTAMDPNGDPLTYTLGGADAARFKVDQDDIDTPNENEGGQIRVGSGTELDKEARDTYMVTVTATDSYGLTATTMVTIMVTDMDEAPEIMVGGLVISGMTSPELEEGSGTEVATYTASGPDAGSATWTLSGDDAGYFSIVPSPSTGVLTFMSAPDYEMPRDMNMDNMYMVTVMAADGTYMDEHMVTVTVTNKDEMGRVTFWRDGADATDAAIRVGDMLTGLVVDPDGMVNSQMWQWSKSMDMNTWMDIQGATDAMYTVMEDDSGYYLRATAMYADGHGSGKMAMQRTAGMVTMVTAVQDQQGTVMLSSMTPVVGTEITATLSDADGAVTGEMWQWASSDMMGGTYTDITGATMASYTPVEGDVGMYLRATAMYTDGHGTGKDAMMESANAVMAEADTGVLGRFDADGSGEIEKVEVVDAIRDYINNVAGITKADVIEVINYYLDN